MLIVVFFFFLLQTLKQEEACLAQLTQAIASVDQNALDSSLALAESLHLSTDETKKAYALQQQVHEATRLVAEGMETRTLATLQNGLDFARRLGMEGQVLMIDAKRVMEEISRQTDALKQLRRAVGDRDCDGITRALGMCNIAGVNEDSADVQEANQVYGKVIKERNALVVLNMALAARNERELTAAIQTATDAGLGDSTEVANATAFLKRMQKEQGIMNSLRHAIEQDDLEHLRTAIAVAATTDMSMTIGFEEMMSLAQVRIRTLEQKQNGLEKLREAMHHRRRSVLSTALESVGLIYSYLFIFFFFFAKTGFLECYLMR
jgi:hypothetical protein